MSTASATSPLALQAAVNTLPACSLNFKQIQEKVNAIASHLSTKVASTVTVASQGGSISALAAEVAALSSALTALTLVVNALATVGKIYQEPVIAVSAAVSYTLSMTPNGVLLLVFLDGVLQLPVNYGVVGNTLTFTGLTMTNYSKLQVIYTHA